MTINIFDRIISFLKESWLEAKKVIASTPREVLRYTLLVIGLSIAIAFFVGGIVFLFNKLLNRIILR